MRSSFCGASCCTCCRRASHSLLRLPRSPQACGVIAAVPPAHCSREAVSHDLPWRRRSHSQRLGLPALWRPNAGRRALQPRSAAAAFAPALAGSRLMQHRIPARSTRLLRREPLWCARLRFYGAFHSLRSLRQHENPALPHAIAAPNGPAQRLSRRRTGAELASEPFAP